MHSFRSTFLSLASAVAVVFFTVVPTRAQSATMEVVATTPGEIVVRIHDVRGVPPTDLDAASFQIRVGDADPVEPQEATTSVDPDATLTIAFIVDASGSMRGGPLDAVRQGLTDALPQLTSADRIALIAASGTIDVDEIDPTRDVDFDADRATFQAALDDMEAAGRSPLYDATYKSVRLLAAQPVTGTASRRAVIILTDGNHSIPPNSGTFNDDSAVIAANQAGVPIFSFAIGRTRDVSYLRRLAELSGGRFTAVDDSTQLTSEINAALSQLRTRYTLRFDSSALPAGSPVTVTLSHRSLQLEAYGSLTSSPVDAPTTAGATTTAVVPAPEPGRNDVSEAPGVRESETQRMEDVGFSFSVSGLPVIGAVAALVLIITLLIVRGIRKPGTAGTRTCRRCGHRTDGGARACPVCGTALS